MKLHADWQWLLRRAWSVRLIALAALLSGAEVVLPLMSDLFPRGMFAILSALVTIAAFIARFVVQSRET